MRKQSITHARPVAEDEFFSPGEKLSSGTKASLAMIAAKQVLVSYPWGELKCRLSLCPTPRWTRQHFASSTVSQERGFESHHLVFLKARPQHTMERW